MHGQITTTPLTMSSREIETLTGKRHSDVMRDIRAMCTELQNANLRFVCNSSTYIGENGQKYPQYELDKDTCLTLLLGYDPITPKASFLQTIPHTFGQFLQEDVCIVVLQYGNTEPLK